jgi:hypothetical protein
METKGQVLVSSGCTVATGVAIHKIIFFAPLRIVRADSPAPFIHIKCLFRRPAPRIGDNVKLGGDTEPRSAAPCAWTQKMNAYKHSRRAVRCDERPLEREARASFKRARDEDGSILASSFTF